jgi:hypothetical protein
VTIAVPVPVTPAVGALTDVVKSPTMLLPENLPEKTFWPVRPGALVLMSVNVRLLVVPTTASSAVPKGPLLPMTDPVELQLNCGVGDINVATVEVPSA